MTIAHDRPTAVLDFALDASATPRRLRFDRPFQVLRANALSEVVPTIDEAERLARAGAWVVGFVSYEASPAFDAALDGAAPGTIPLAWFAAFSAAQSVEPPRTDRDLASCEETDASILDPRTTLSDAEYHAGVARIRDYITRGDVYQVNLTVPFVADPRTTPLALYERLRSAQSGAYSAYLDLGDIQIMSASPELFLARRGATVRSKPMKGTASRGLDVRGDRDARDALTASEKDRAENVMIVDVVRNDLGRVARVGSVRVPSLCEPERYPRVWQLTSTVEAEVAPDAPLSAIFGALFPAGSITGAPKIRATQIIRELERAPRGVYCGAVGVIEPGGDATFNVAIRTGWTDDGGATIHLNAGGGITIDSTGLGELAELRAKLAAFTEVGPTPGLFETMRVEAGEVRLLDRHLARIAASADYFALPFDPVLARSVTLAAARQSAGLAVGRARLVLEPGGALRCDVEPFTDHASEPGARLRVVSLARTAVDRRDVTLYHKTTCRDRYDQALAEAKGCFDVLLWNSDGEVTEFTRGNVVVQVDGARWTPPVESGLLGGVRREMLLEAGEVRERVVRVEEMARAERVWFVNALRGWVEVGWRVTTIT